MVKPAAHDFYGATVVSLTEHGVPFVVGGAFALKHYAGIARDTKDLDVFIRREHVARALAALETDGFSTEEVFPHWLAKAYYGDFFVDFIFNSANGLCPVDDAWFRYAPTITIFDVPARLCPVEEVIWTKSFVMERERFDGADVYHLLAAQGRSLDWERLVERFGAQWRVLLGHLTFFAFVYPRERDAVPSWVLDSLLAKTSAERAAEDAPVCNGTLISREQYLVDVRERGLADARVPPWGNVAQVHIDRWTDAIGKIK
jgi:hypothetical protein